MGSIKELILRSKLKNRSKSATAFVPWEKAKSIALIIDAQTANNKNLIDKFIYESDKVVDVYYIDLKVKESVIKNYITFTKQHKNVVGLPNAKAVQVLTKKYDVLINAAFHEVSYAAVLSNALAATCKASFISQYSTFNLIIQREANQEVSAYLKDVVVYLKMIRN